jgi:hypothetical protein
MLFLLPMRIGESSLQFSLFGSFGITQFGFFGNFGIFGNC